MDIASRIQPARQRAPAYLDRNSSVAEDSGTESESFIRRKFQRTNAAATNPNDNTFRKPSIPASASRPSTEQRPSFSHSRRRSTALRENVRVPSGPREFPSPHKRVASGSFYSTTPSMSEATNTSRTFLTHSTTEPNFSKNADVRRFSFVNRSSTDVTDLPTTPAYQAGSDLDFIPSVNFDDLQNSIANYDGDGPLLSNFPEVGGRTSTKLKSGNMLRDASLNASRPPVPKLEPRAEQAMSRSASLRRRLSAVTGGKPSNTPNLPNNLSDGTPQASNLSLRTRRQSAAPQGPPPAEPAPPPLGAGSRQPRKSLGPGVLTSMMEGRKASQPLPTSGTDPALKSALARSGSLTKAQRRTTMQPPASGGAELPRVATFSATTQSRANKVKSLGPPAREPQEPNTPNGKTATRSGQNRAHTPSSSGNKRQSTMSGRASGLGARTISPTDARRLKRISMMQAPPLPSNPSTSSIPKLPVQAQEEQPAKTEVPRLAQPSPSLIPQPQGFSNATPSSARASPENRISQQYGGIQLSAKSSFSSLVNSGSTSRLPTPKSRSVHSSTAQYSEEGEAVPPVPAIPKAYESPRDADHPPFFSGITKSSQGGCDVVPIDAEGEPASNHRRAKLSGDRLLEAKTRTSFERPRPHDRMNTIDNIERSITLTAAKPQRPQNNNLQPLRLPPLNLMPINHRDANRSNYYPRPSQDLEAREDASVAQTPEPKRIAKTPSTPMTASKATFSGRQYEDFGKQKNMRSVSSHYALRDLMQSDDDTTKFFDDSDAEFMGVPIPSTKQRSAITPFSSGSLPKASGEFARQRSRPSGEYTGENSMSNFEEFQQQSIKPQGPRPSRSGTNNTIASYKTAETSSVHSPVESPGQSEGKKESSGGGLRRKLSLGWRRSSSKSNIQTDNKSSPRGEGSLTADNDKNALQKLANQMLPPKLPASATWTGEIPSIPPPSTRPSFDSMRRKSTAASVNTLSTINVDADQNLTMPAIKTRSMHSEQPQPVNGSNRATSWSTLNPTRPPTKAPPNLVKSRQAAASATISAIIKDKDDLTADDEMKRLSQKRRDVDTAAKDSEELKKRAVARSPKSPENVLHDRTAALNIFERGEIMDYENQGVYFTGTKNARKIIGSLTPSPQPGDKDPKAGNYGYDDERGDYNIVLGDHLAYRYEVVDMLGKGSFGQVVRCVDHKDGGIVAVKIIRNKKRFHQQALVEVGILGRLREWDPDQTHATLSITSSFYFRSHLCIVTPCLSINLYELIRAHNFVGFTLPLIRRFARQLLSCLVLLQNKQIIHCDLKPENILLCEARKADVRVIDFGSSCKESEKVYTYIQSRFYRSPEVILGSSYGLGIDMWSLGCILAELWTGYPLFPGENEQEQLACIMEIFGPPDRHLVERCTRKKLFFDSVGKPRVTVSSKGRRRRPSSKTLSQALKSEDEAFLDFVARCLRWDPDRRLKPHDAVNHPFITNQPFHQRSGGIPDEARRAARLRATAAAPATNGGIPSPVKRTQAATAAPTISGNAFAQQQAQAQQTPAKERSRPLPETPQTAVRNDGPVLAGSTTHGSPSKRVPLNRRESGVPAANIAPVAGAKRTNNGQVSTGNNSGPTFLQRQTSASSSNTAGSLAQMAAREANNAARWRM